MVHEDGCGWSLRPGTETCRNDDISMCRLMEDVAKRVYLQAAKGLRRQKPSCAKKGLRRVSSKLDHQQVRHKCLELVRVAESD